MGHPRPDAFPSFADQLVAGFLKVDPFDPIHHVHGAVFIQPEGNGDSGFVKQGAAAGTILKETLVTW
jgi:hypothetical protein